MKRRPVLVFDLTPGADVERHPVVRFRIVAFEGGEPPDFLPEWVEVDRLELLINWPGPDLGIARGYEIPADTHTLAPRAAAGAIHGFIERKPNTTSRRGAPFATLAWDSPGSIKPLRALFEMYDKRFPWRLTKVQLPAGVVEQVKL